MNATSVLSSILGHRHTMIRARAEVPTCIHNSKANSATDQFGIGFCLSWNCCHVAVANTCMHKYIRTHAHLTIWTTANKSSMIRSPGLWRGGRSASIFAQTHSAIWMWVGDELDTIEGKLDFRYQLVRLMVALLARCAGDWTLLCRFH